MQKLKDHGRFVVAAIALAIAFVLSVQFSDRGVEFDLRNSAHSASATTEEGDYDLASLKILNRVLLQIKDNYVEPDRIEPNKMLVYALDEIQNSIAEVVVDFDRHKDENPQAVTVSVNERSKQFQVGNIESLWEMSFRLKEIFGFVQDHLDPENSEIEYRDVEYAAINGMLATLDPHSLLLPPRHYEEMQTQTGGKFGGLGIVISVRDGQLTVISPIDGTPASKKGLKARDKIVRIGDESTVNMGLSEAVNMLRGEPGTPCDLYVLRKGWEEPRKFTVTRAVIKIDSVDSQPLKNKVGYVRIKNFQANTYPDLKSHVDKLREKMGGIQGLVLDLRDNPGGLLDQSIKVSDFFLDKGTIVSTVGVGNRMREKRDARETGTEPRYPIIVLVNAGSASASEIVAGALRNHDRAMVIGDTTFGKGSVQVLYEFPDNSALKLTVAQYLTPGDVSIQSKGITPDLGVFPVIIAKEQVDLYPSTHVPREQDLDAHLTNESARPKSAELYQLRYLDEELSRKIDSDEEDDGFEDPEAFKEDFEIRLAQELLSEVGGTWKRPEMLNKLTSSLKNVEEREEDTIRKELRRYQVDWSRGVSPEKPDLGVKLTTSAEGQVIKAGEKVTMTAKVTNRGSKPVYQLKALSVSANGMLDDREFLFGKVNPGESKSWDVDVTLPKDTSTRHDVVEFEFSDESREFDQVAATLEVDIEGNPQPQFAFSYDLQDASGNGQLSKDEDATLRVFVRNVGKADAEETLVTLKNLANEAVYLKRGRETIDGIKAGEQVAVEFKFKVKEAPKKDRIDLEVDVYDTTYRQLTMKKFSIPYVEQDTSVSKLDGLAKVVKGPVKLFVGAGTASDVAALASSDTALPVRARTDDWVQVDLDGRLAWIQNKQVQLAKGAAQAVKGLKKSVMYQPPSIDVEPARRITSSKNINLSGAASDDSSVKDYYIFVYNRDKTKVNTRKFKYVKTSGEKIKIDASVPLFKGMNRIAIVARDDDGMSTTENTYVYRK